MQHKKQCKTEISFPIRQCFCIPFSHFKQFVVPDYDLLLKCIAVIKYIYASCVDLHGITI